jgi:hypothetical protein
MISAMTYVLGPTEHLPLGVKDKASASPDAGRLLRLGFMGSGLAVLAAIAPLALESLVHAPATDRAMATIAASPALQAAIIMQNEVLAGEDQAAIDAYDRAWMAESKAGDGPLTRAHLALPASVELRRIAAASGGTVGQIILMDERGRNVALAAMSHDYWQGDEAKFTETFPKGAAGRHVGAPERGQASTGQEAGFVACWVSQTITDRRTGLPIGAMAIEVNAERAGMGFCAKP